MFIYPSITTTNSDWRERIAEIKTLGLKEIGFFPTCLDKAKRQEAYALLEQAGVAKMPFVHLRTDMTADEVDYLLTHFKTQAFNIHTVNVHRMDYDLSAFKNLIYIENQMHYFATDELDKWAGLCLDFSHLENARLNQLPIYDYFYDLATRYPSGCAHVNAIKSQSQMEDGIKGYDYHDYDNLNQFDYLLKYKALMPPIVALELENSLADQLVACSYIERLLAV